MACVFAVQVKSWLNITRVAVQTFKVTEKLSWYCYFINSTGAVSQYNLSRSQKLVKVQKFDCEYWSEVRVPRSAGIVLVAGARAKTMTNNLPILSVLAFRANFKTVFDNQIPSIVVRQWIYFSRYKFDYRQNIDMMQN